MTREMAEKIRKHMSESVSEWMAIVQELALQVREKNERIKSLEKELKRKKN